MFYFPLLLHDTLFGVVNEESNDSMSKPRMAETSRLQKNYQLRYSVIAPKVFHSRVKEFRGSGNLTRLIRDSSLVWASIHFHEAMDWPLWPIVHPRPASENCVYRDCAQPISQPPKSIRIWCLFDLLPSVLLLALALLIQLPHCILAIMRRHWYWNTRGLPVFVLNGYVSEL